MSFKKLNSALISAMTLGLIAFSSTTFAAVAARDANLTRELHLNRVVSKSRLTRMLREAIKNAEHFAVLAQASNVESETRSQLLKESIANAKSDFKAAQTFLSTQNTSSEMKAQLKKLGTKLDDVEALVQPSTFYRAGDVAKSTTSELNAIAALLDLKI